jgi:beta-glucosidase
MKELKGYVRLTLKPGASKTVTFSLPVDQLAFYDNELNLVLEPGRILVMIGSSSDDIRLTGEFEIIGEGKISVKNRVFVCPVQVQEENH